MESSKFFFFRYSTEWGIFRLGVHDKHRILKKGLFGHIFSESSQAKKNHWTQLLCGEQSLKPTEVVYDIFRALFGSGSWIIPYETQWISFQQRRGTLRIMGNPAQKKGALRMCFCCRTLESPNHQWLEIPADS